MSNIVSFGNGDIAAEYSNITLLTSGWSDGVYTISDPRITAFSTQYFSPQAGITSEQLEALQGANIIGYGQSAGQAQIKAYGDVPEIDIPITVIFTPGIQLKEVENDIGNTDISSIGDGTVTGAISALNNRIAEEFALTSNQGAYYYGSGIFLKSSKTVIINFTGSTTTNVAMRAPLMTVPEKYRPSAEITGYAFMFNDSSPISDIIYLSTDGVITQASTGYLRHITGTFVYTIS